MPTNYMITNLFNRLKNIYNVIMTFLGHYCPQTLIEKFY